MVDDSFQDLESKLAWLLSEGDEPGMTSDRATIRYVNRNRALAATVRAIKKVIDETVDKRVEEKIREILGDDGK